jgi:hypothetical protein
MGATKTVALRLVGGAPAPVTAAAPSGIVPASGSTPTNAPGFWAAASTGEKVAIVGGGAVALGLLVLAFKPTTRRRRRR